MMPKLGRHELFSALKDRDMGDLKEFRMEQLALALKEELDVTLLRAKKAGQLFRLLNGQTQDRMKNGSVAVAPHDPSLEMFFPENTAAQLPREDVLPVPPKPVTTPPMTDADTTTTPATPAKPVPAPEEQPVTMAA